MVFLIEWNQLQLGEAQSPKLIRGVVILSGHIWLLKSKSLLSDKTKDDDIWFT